MLRLVDQNADIFSLANLSFLTAKYTTIAAIVNIFSPIFRNDLVSHIEGNSADDCSSR